MPILTQFVQDRLADRDLVIIAPDAGRVKLVRKFAQKVGAPYALMEKERPAQQVAEIGYVIGDVKGKTALIIDDIIDTGGTLAAAGQTVLDAGAKCVYAAATHGLFSGDAHRILRDGPFEQIVVTDTVPLREGAPDNIIQLSVAPLLAQSIEAIFTNRPISDVFQGQNQPF
jgi:ribose-phosphate pyrophosphokinase